MSVKNIVQAMPMISIDSATFTGAYQLLTAAAGLTVAPFLIIFINNSDRDITISYDGVIDHDFNPAFIGTIPTQRNFQTNSQPQSHVALLPLGQKVYVKGLAGGTGLFYMVGYYSPRGA